MGKRLHYIIHGVHHDYPNDAKRLVMPPSISVPLAFLFYGMFLLIFGRFASSAFAGLVFGYVCYDMLHYATHHFPMKRGVLLWLKQYHLRHHYKDDHVGYGISSPLVGLRFPDDAEVKAEHQRNGFLAIRAIRRLRSRFLVAGSTIPNRLFTGGRSSNQKVLS